MEALSAEGGSIERSRVLLASVRPRLAGLGTRASESRVWLLEADAAADTVENRMLPARRKIAAAAVLADSMPDRIDAETRLLLHERLAIAEARLGDWDAADREATGLQRQADALQGPDHPDMLLIRLMQARSLLVRGRFAQALARFDLLYPKLVATFGPDHRQTLIALMVRAQAEVYLGHDEDGIRDEMTVYRTALGQSGEHGYFAIGPLSDAGGAVPERTRGRRPRQPHPRAGAGHQHLRRGQRPGTVRVAEHGFLPGADETLRRGGGAARPSRSAEVRQRRRAARRCRPRPRVADPAAVGILPARGRSVSGELVAAAGR